MAARILRLTGHPVEVCRNITDVNDRLLLSAKVTCPMEVVRHPTVLPLRRNQLDLLGISHPAFEPCSHDLVNGVVALAWTPDPRCHL